MSSRLASRYADPQRIVERRDQRADVGREAGRERQRAVDELLQPPHVRVDLERSLARLGQRLDQRRQ
jgi:hypothetical protein